MKRSGAADMNPAAAAAAAAAAAPKSLHLCPTLWDPKDGSPPGSTVPGILQARTLKWVAISFSNAWKWKVKVKSLSHVWLFATPWTAAYQAPPSMGFSRQEYLEWVAIAFSGYEPYFIGNSLRKDMQLSREWVSVSCSVVSDSLWPHGLLPARLLCPWDFSGRNTGVGCQFLLQEIFPTQGLNLCLLHCRQILYHLSHWRNSYFKKIV